MTLKKRLCVGVLSLATALSAMTASAQPTPRPLSPQDAAAYASAFAAVDQGDFVGAEISAAEIQDKSLLGYLSFRALMHPTAHKAAFEEHGQTEHFKTLGAGELFGLMESRERAFYETL